MRWLALVLVVICATSCKGKATDAPCGVVAGRLFTIAREDLDTAKVDPATRRAVENQLPAMRDALTQICTDSSWSAQVRNCMANAADHAAFQACQAQLTDDQRSGLDRAARGETNSR